MVIPDRRRRPWWTQPSRGCGRDDRGGRHRHGHARDLKGVAIDLEVAGRGGRVVPPPRAEPAIEYASPNRMLYVRGTPIAWKTSSPPAPLPVIENASPCTQLLSPVYKSGSVRSRSGCRRGRHRHGRRRPERVGTSSLAQRQSSCAVPFQWLAARARLHIRDSRVRPHTTEVGSRVALLPHSHPIACRPWLWLTAGQRAGGEADATGAIRGWPGGRGISADLGDGHRRVAGWDTVYDLAAEAIAEGRSLAELVAEQLTTERWISPAWRPKAACCRLWTTRATGAHAGHRHRAVASGLGRGARQDAPRPGRGGDAHRQHAHVQARARGRQAGSGAGRRAAGMVLQGRRLGSSPRRASPWRARPSRSTAARSRRSSGLYLIGADTQPWRVGFALGNEFSDHVTEKQNYLYLAHSKLRACSIGPELLVGDLPRDLRGTSRIRRGGAVVWEKPFLSGEGNMCHSIENLERHHFKYPAVPPPRRRPRTLLRHLDAELLGRVQDAARRRVRDRDGAFGRPLRNALALSPR